MIRYRPISWSALGIPVLRLRGIYFAIATIATSLVLKDLFEVWNFVGAARGLEISPIKYQPPDFVRLIFKEDIYYFYVLLGFFLIGILYDFLTLNEQISIANSDY